MNTLCSKLTVRYVKLATALKFDKHEKTRGRQELTSSTKCTKLYLYMASPLLQGMEVIHMEFSQVKSPVAGHWSVMSIEWPTAFEQTADWLRR